MRLTKFAHSCVGFDDGNSTLVIDPGVFSAAAEATEPDHLLPSADNLAVLPRRERSR